MARRFDSPGTAVRTCISLLGLVGLGFSAYLLWVSRSSAQVVGCDPDSGAACDVVLSDPWSKWLGMPVAAGSLIVYASIVFSSFWIGAGALRRHRRLAWPVLLCGSITAAGAALWFIGVQVFKLNSYCYYCLAVHACGLIIAALVVWRLPIGPESQGDRGALVRKPQGLLSAGAGAALLASLVLGQILHDPDPLVHEVAAATVDSQPPDPIRHDGEPPGQSDVPAVFGSESATETTADTAATATEDPTAVATVDPSSAAVPTTQPEEPIEQRLIGIMNRRYEVDAYNEPVVGSRDATTVIVELFDYTCPHCRRLHADVGKIRDRYGDQLAIVLCPTPLNPRCNRYIQRTPYQHLYACELARLALAIWRVDREAFPEFHAWLMESDRAPSPKRAFERAKELFDEETIMTAVNDIWITNTIRRNTKIHDRSVGKGLPKFISLQHVVTPHPGELHKFVERRLKIRPARR